MIFKMKNKKGVALVLAMFILVFISMLVGAFLILLTSDLTIANNHLGRLKALYIAEAGVEHAISQLRTSVTWSANPYTEIFPTGSNNSYVVTRTAGSRVITSIGNIDNKFTAQIEARISIKSSSPKNIIKIVSFKETG